MSVLIRGMEMPASCLTCPHHEHGTIHEWELYCGLTGDYIGHWDDKSLNNGRRPEYCPLVEVPPHGPLIDRDELRTFMYHHAFELDSVDQRWDSGCWIRYRLFENAMKVAPTIIEAEKE